ncbi:methyltransferase domain-containing protein [Candidatus Methanocrinis natronophilus]|uniref:Methyltransferase domain-containing protein n=1 Tax=Candidatus Methanocrinis natronophilus TaxID=3033396 RepID=A0ABT5X5A4_9EURY|nr:methyltransferase domain-containing protein [Candidatus Methanocrinis natronophilus]MDF0589767.1 methyltransferase domain-containing protein [Candidatus Methanocrinis natronophilus]
MTFHSIFARFTAAFEKIASRSTVLSEMYAFPYREVVAREISLANIRSGERVLNVGCGAVPFTAIHIARLTQARVLALDRDPDVVRSARACIRRMNLEDRIEVELGDASENVPEDFDAAIVALQAEPKYEIFKKLQERCGSRTPLIFRAPSPSFKDRYDSLPDTLLHDAAIRQSMATFDRSLLYQAAAQG